MSDAIIFAVLGLIVGGLIFAGGWLSARLRSRDEARGNNANLRDPERHHADARA